MPKYLVKRILWLVILIVGAGLALQVLSGVGDLIAYFQQGADPQSALNIVPNVPPDLDVGLHWLPDDSDPGRQMEPLTRIDIQSAYLRAWLQWNLSFLKKEPYGLQTYFVGPALADVSSNINAVAAKGWQVEQVDTAHALQLHFYSADGSIVSFTDRGANVVTIVHDKDGNILSIGESAAVYNVVMFLEDGNWRVRHLMRVSDDFINRTAPPLQTPPGFVGKDGTQLTLNGRPYHIAGMNYYPKDTPWDKFWSSYTPAIIDHDFSRMQSLGINTVRIFIPFDQFGGAHIEGENRLPQGISYAGVDTETTNNANLVQYPLEKLTDLLQSASDHTLHVIVTLFDFRSDYSLLHWPSADRHLETLLKRFTNNPAILAWDLKNEPDQDYRSAGKELVDSWLTHIAHLARTYDPHHLLTIGWSTPQAAQAHITPLDFVSFHYYAPANRFAHAYTSLRTAVAGEPIVLGEFGLPTWNSFFFPGGHSEAEQAEYYADILKFLRRSDCAGYIAWTLYDFSYVPPAVAGRWPWQTGPQGAMGILRSNGSAKPAAYLLAPGARLDAPVVSGLAHLLKPFWLTVAVVFATGMILMIWVFVQKKS